MIPAVGLGDDAEIVAVCKLASIVLVSNESINDTDVNLTRQIGSLLEDSASTELDHEILYGEGAPAPAGVVAAVPEAAADLAGALTEAIGSIGDAGGTVSHLAAKPSVLAHARNERDNEDRPLWPGSLGAAFGLTGVAVPELESDDVLAFDQSRVYLIVNTDFAVDLSFDWAFNRDAGAIRLKGLFAVATPVVQKAMRKLTVGATAQAGSTAPPAKAAPAKH